MLINFLINLNFLNFMKLTIRLEVSEFKYLAGTLDYWVCRYLKRAALFWLHRRPLLT